MAVDNERGPLFRPIVPNQHSRVTYAELFFDLVFVFAVTQISHTLLANFTPLGAVQTTLLLLSVWWVWVYTSWITNWLNPELTPVRVLLFLLMLGGLVLSTSIPTAFDSRGLWFALAYAAMQVGRTLFWLGSTPRGRAAATLNSVRAPVSSCARSCPARALDAGPGNRIHLARGAVLDTEIRRVLDGGLVYRGWSHGRALRWLHHHRARRIHRRDRREIRRSDLDQGSGRSLPVLVRRFACDVVDLFSQGRGGRFRADLEFKRAGASGEACLHLPASADRGRYHPLCRRR